jgi:hypothetical protein
MKYLIVTVLLLYIYDAKALEIKLTQGHAVHFMASDMYQDNIFNDNLTSTNTLLTIQHSNYALTLLSDSQGKGSAALTYNTKLSSQFTLVAGLYLLRDKDILKYEPKSPILLFPSFSVGPRSFLITPLIGIQHSLPLTRSVSLDTLISPAFVLVGLTIKMGEL